MASIFFEFLEAGESWGLLMPRYIHISHQGGLHLVLFGFRILAPFTALHHDPIRILEHNLVVIIKLLQFIIESLLVHPVIQFHSQMFLQTIQYKLCHTANHPQVFLYDPLYVFLGP